MTAKERKWLISFVVALTVQVWGCSGRCGEPDVPGAVGAAFDWAITEGNISDRSLLEAKGSIFVLAEGVEPSWITPPPDTAVVFVDRVELARRAAQVGDFMYLSFEDVSVLEEGLVEMRLSTQWALAPMSETLKLSGESLKLRLRRSRCDWAVEEEYRVISDTVTDPNGRGVWPRIPAIVCRPSPNMRLRRG